MFLNLKIWVSDMEGHTPYYPTIQLIYGFLSVILHNYEIAKKNIKLQNNLKLLNKFV